jgi:hypothetical protein
MVKNLAFGFRGFHYLGRNRITSRHRSSSAPSETTMMILLAILPPLATLGSWLLNLASFVVARTLNVPQPLVHSTGIYVYAQVEAVETSIGKSLCPRRLWRQFRALFVRLVH